MLPGFLVAQILAQALPLFVRAAKTIQLQSSLLMCVSAMPDTTWIHRACVPNACPEHSSQMSAIQVALTVQTIHYQLVDQAQDWTAHVGEASRALTVAHVPSALLGNILRHKALSRHVCSAHTTLQLYSLAAQGLIIPLLRACATLDTQDQMVGAVFSAMKASTKMMTPQRALTCLENERVMWR